jgi:hypothetical protein
MIARTLRISLLGLPLLALASGCAGLNLTSVQNTAEKPSNVAIYFKVETNDGDPVAGMTAEQFEIYEDDQLVSVYESQQTILNPEVTATHYTLLLVDMSGSVAESDDRSQVVEAARVFTEKVETNNRVGIYAFDGEAELHKIVGFTKSANSADARAGSLDGFSPKDTSTNLNGAIVAGLEELDAALEDAETPLRIGTLVVFTDGTDRAARVDTSTMLEAVHDSPHDVFAIGLGAELSEDDLEDIGKSGTSMAHERGNVVEAFEAIGTKIEAMTRSYYLLSYCSPARAQEHEVRIEAATTIKDEKGKDEEYTGELESWFDAEGFEAGCDPNKAPTFDVSLGEHAGGDGDGDARASAKGNGKGKGKLEGKAELSSDD